MGLSAYTRVFGIRTSFGICGVIYVYLPTHGSLVFVSHHESQDIDGKDHVIVE